ncbi:hypothetical protein AOQ84DRAFT_355741 [Glonium stellatum]|uniref:Uncharacterized protein n=1 Tax=Glonium stellatum TaxID=574774 RepID=A0A8E2EWK4_9PEZI|nr:hypothetical protein AOQ84DRAFT_355741 [Glonium stellatum]
MRDSVGDNSVNDGLGELLDTTEEKRGLQILDEHSQFTLQTPSPAPRIPGSYPQPSYDAGLVSIPDEKRNSVDITRIGIQPVIDEPERGLPLLSDGVLSTESATRLSHVNTHPEESKRADIHSVESGRASIPTFITAPSFQSSIETFKTATSGLRSIKRESAASMSNPFRRIFTSQDFTSANKPVEAHSTSY